MWIKDEDYNKLLLSNNKAYIMLSFLLTFVCLLENIRILDFLSGMAAACFLFFALIRYRIHEEIMRGGTDGDRS